MSVVGVLGYEANHVDVQLAFLKHEYLQVGIGAVLRGSEYGSVLLPLLVIYIDGGFGEYLGLAAGGCQYDAHGLCLAADIAHEDAEVVLFTGLHVHAVEAVVHQAYSGPSVVILVVTDALGIDAHIGGIVGMDGILMTVNDVAG